MSPKVRKVIHDIVLALSTKKVRKALLTCPEVTKSLANREDLGAVGRFQIRVHLFICNCCVDFRNDLADVDAFLKSADFTQDEVSLPAQEKLEQKIIETHVARPPESST